MTRIRVEVPASSANLGPGFDSLALALAITDTVSVDLDADSEKVTLAAFSGDGAYLDPHDNLLCRAYRAWGEDTGQRLPGARFSVESRIPIGKGFGTSAAAIVAGLAAAAHATGDKDPRDRILRLAIRLEPHPDNVVAATLGGVTAAFRDGAEVRALNIANHLTIGVGVFVPEERLPTVRARRVLPEKIPLRDAVYNIGRATYLTTALLWGKWELIGPAMQDKLHQPYRKGLIPALEPVIAAAIEGGAYGAALSGGGPSVLALGPRDRADEFTAAMESRAATLHWHGTGMVTGIRHVGVVVSDEL